MGSDGAHKPALAEGRVSLSRHRKNKKTVGKKASGRGIAHRSQEESRVSLILLFPLAHPRTPHQQAHFEASSGPPGLGVGGPDEEATLHASVQGPLQQVLEPDGIHRRVLSQDVHLDGDHRGAPALLSCLQCLQHHAQHGRVTAWCLDATMAWAYGWTAGHHSAPKPPLGPTYSKHVEQSMHQVQARPNGGWAKGLGDQIHPKSVSLSTVTL